MLLVALCFALFKCKFYEENPALNQPHDSDLGLVIVQVCLFSLRLEIQTSACIALALCF